MIYGEWFYNILRDSPPMGILIIINLIILAVCCVRIVDWDERRQYNKHK